MIWIVLTISSNRHIIYLMDFLNRMIQTGNWLYWAGRRRLNMKDIMVLRELDQIKAIAHPYRIKILSCFEEEPATAKQIADRMGEPHAKINYHIKTLQRVGILQLVDERAKSGIVEKYYLPAAKAFIIHKSIKNADIKKEYGDITHAFCKAIENIQEGFNLSLYIKECYLSQDQMNILSDKLKDVIEDFIDDQKKGEDQKTCSITSLIFSEE